MISLIGDSCKIYKKKRFTEEQINKLLKNKWLDRDDEKINKFTPLLCNTDIDKFINTVL